MGINKYQKIYMQIKEIIDRMLAAVGAFILAPVFLGIILAIKLEDGLTAPVFFTQKRVGIGKSHFQLYKFRSMRLDTPHDTPTHLLENPDQYITKVGRFLRKTSLDELPQIWNILKGEMAVIGPRPALWNQFDLIAERDKYGANDVKPGLTGWAQINGRDELEIEEKAKLDGYYVKHMGLIMDIRCFFGTIGAVLASDGVVEGGTGELKKKKKILIITNHSYMFFRFRKELTEELLKEYQVYISTPFVGHEKDLEALGCKMIETTVDRRGVNPATDFKLLLTYYKMIKEIKPEMVITYSIKPNIYAGMVCRMRKVPYCTNVQGLGTAFQKKGIAEMVTFLYKIALKNAVTVFFENEENARIFRYKKITPANQQTILAGAGINLEDYKYAAYPENERNHFLYLGRIMKEKGMDETFYAVEKLHKKYGDAVVLDLVGFYEDEYKSQVEKLEKAGCVVFHGFQENPVPFYEKADCVVLASYHEGMSNVLLEAASVGRPVITSDIPGCRETVVDGKTGLLCEVKNKKSLYDTMDRFMQLDREAREVMGKAGREHMENVFDKKKVVEQTVKAIFR